MAAKNAATPEAIEAQAKAIAEAERQLKIDLNQLLKQPAFMRFYSWLLTETDPMGVAFDTNGSLTNFRLGRQEVGKMLWNMLEGQPRGTFENVRYAWVDLKKEKGDA